MKSIEIFSSLSNREEAFKDVCSQIDAISKEPVLIIFFNNDFQDFIYYAEAFKKNYPDSKNIGSTTYMNMTSKGWGRNALSGLVIFDGIEVAGDLLYFIDKHPMMYVDHIRKAVGKLSSTENTCCLEFCTAFSQGEELVLDTFERGLEGTGIPVVGGSSGNKLEDQKSVVAWDGVVYVNTSAFVLIHSLEGKMHFYRENIFKPTDNIFEATDVDCDERIVYEYDDKPAADVIANALGVDFDTLPELQYLHPMGRIVDDNIYITEPSEIHDDGSISYYSRIYNHTKVVLLDVDDMEAVWKKTADKIKKEVPNPSCTIAINCLSRTKLFEKENKLEKFIETLKPAVGNFATLSGFGEQLYNVHLNQSLVLVVFE